MTRFIPLICTLMLGIAPLAHAHHSGAAFDPDIKVAVDGTVNHVEWTSPHARLYVDSKDGEGNVVTWDFELPSPVTLMRRGWSKSSLPIGANVHVEGIRAREYPTIAVAKKVLNDGKSLFE
ncbi:MAG: hypothetical protein H6978_02900 [Gammaproteobacteria bacterium]|nr:hypothetical protein [Gammaproteobacteria bacterium]